MTGLQASCFLIYYLGLALLLLVHVVGTVIAAVDFTRCLNDIMVYSTVTEILYRMFLMQHRSATRCAHPDVVTGKNLSSGLYFCKNSLPFGAQYRLDNLMSTVLTVGSPTLAGYSLFITLLNSRWIKRRFDHLVDYPNSRFALSILSSLQQVPLRLHPDRVRLPSLLVLPENDSWWKCLAEFVDYTHTWSIASATSIAWVVAAYIFTVANSLDINVAANGEATGSMWLWLIPIVVGWLQLSPKCDFNRLQAAYDRADRHSMRTETADIRAGMLPASFRRALAITAKEEDVMSPDELLTPPVFNYSRSLRWASTAETIFMVFKVASEKAHSHLPVCGSDRAESDITIESRHLHDVAVYCAQLNGMQSSHWAPGVFTRMVIASCASLALQWGTVGAAFMATWFSPTTGMGCRSMSYLLYGAISTLIWMMLLMSSILAHSSAADPRQVSPSARVTLAFSHVLRWTGKSLALLNFFLAIMACVFHYSNFYDTCYCNSSVFSRRGAAYAVIIETTAQAAQAKAAWIGALVLACTSASVFLGILNLLLDTLPS
ncbi:uncharacterized protein BJ212DRAFT_1297883 [Suillus subaureus]|uniref:Uncharacterized protein n=1 Tax=Suillus subaureus TaxID=48587 RepID=A0A9P7JG85_9AGAM|nr:uncharacterized protein BJ212DRAFT_1297883 [Suillus subaureus]KAG1820504.1 hypothetical protein BJ212DRAFT_1297883 [Suillus subaureus]